MRVLVGNDLKQRAKVTMRTYVQSMVVLGFLAWAVDVSAQTRPPGGLGGTGSGAMPAPAPPTPTPPAGSTAKGIQYRYGQANGHVYTPYANAPVHIGSPCIVCGANWPSIVNIRVSLRGLQLPIQTTIGRVTRINLRGAGRIQLTQ